MAQVTDPYRTLGVKRSATAAQIKAAHRALAKRYHPDADGGDAVRFVLVQEAYKLLTDPLRRREWDARHAPGPVRAGQPGTSRPRAPGASGQRQGPATRAPDEPPDQPADDDYGRRRGSAAGDPAAGVPRDPAAHRYTWSASEVPWWEDGARREHRRQPGGRRPRGATAGDGGPAADPGQPLPGAGYPSSTSAPPDFDVYNRSSGAAWSMAARAYFRRSDQELPRRGSFHRQGSQPLTAARARVAAEEEARRRPTDPARDGRSGPPSWSSPRAQPASARQRPARAAPGWASAGVARDIYHVNRARDVARRRALAAAWPSLGQRLGYALLAWIPIATAIGYGGAVATGCDRAAIGCPSYLELVQLVLIGLALALLVALPRVAYVAALATVGLLAGSALIVAGVWLLGLQRPLSSSVLVVSSAALLVIYLATATWIVAAGPRRRPWSA